MVRGTVVLPHGTGVVRVVAIVAADKEAESRTSWCRIRWLRRNSTEDPVGLADFDTVVTTPDMMRHVGKLGKVLGLGE